MTTISAGTTSTTAYVATPDTTGTLVLKTGASNATALTLDASQNATFAGSIPSVGGYPSYQCRAWVNFNGTGTVAIRASGNVSSITDNGVGGYTVNFTTAMVDANYSVTGSCAQSGSGGRWMQVSSAAAQTTTTYRVTTYNNSNAATDLEFVQTAIFR